MTDTALGAAELANILGVSAVNWPGMGLTVVRGTPSDPETADEVTVRKGDRIIGYTEPSTEFPGQRVYRAVIAEDVPSVPFPAGFVPPDPLRAQRSEQLRWLPTGHPDRPGEGTAR